MIIGYAKVTETREELSAQQKEIAKSARSFGLLVDMYYNFSDINLLKICSLNRGDAIFMTNISDFGNRLADIKENISFFIDKGVSVYSAKEGFVFHPDDKTRNLLKGLDLAISIRNSMISCTTVKALARAKNSGRRLGQKKGVKLKRILDGRENEIRSLLLKKIPKTEIARRLNVAYATLFNFLKEHQYILGEIS